MRRNPLGRKTGNKAPCYPVNTVIVRCAYNGIRRRPTHVPFERQLVHVRRSEEFRGIPRKERRRPLSIMTSSIIFLFDLVDLRIQLFPMFLLIDLFIFWLMNYYIIFYDFQDEDFLQRKAAALQADSVKQGITPQHLCMVSV